MSAAGLRAALAGIEARWAAHGVVLNERLGTGVSGDVVADTLASIDLPVPDEVATWFGYHGGVGGADTAQARQIAGLVIFDLGGSVELHGRILETVARLSTGIDIEGEPSELWNPAWLPIVSTPDGDFGVECVAGAPESPVWFYKSGPAVAVKVADSLAELVEGWNTLIDDGWWVWHDEGGYWEDQLGIPDNLAKYFQM